MQQAAGESLAQALQEAGRLVQHGQAEAAKALLARILKQVPQQPDALQLMGIVARRQGNPAAAEDWFRRSLAANPAQPHVQNNLANALKAQDRLEEAIRAYREALRDKPDYLDAWINLGLTLAASQAHEKALEAYDRALALAPGSAKALNGKALTLQALDRLREAEETARAAVEAAPETRDGLNNLGNILRERGKEADGAGVFEKAAALYPEATHLKVALSGAYYNLGRFTDAEAALQSVLSSEPDNLEAHRTLASLLVTTGREGEVPAAYERALCERPNVVSLWHSYIDRLWYLERHDSALEVLDRAERACGPQPIFRLYRGRLVSSKGDPETALTHLAFAPEDPPEIRRSIHIERARAHIRLGRFAAGARELEPAALAAPKDYTLLTHLEALWRLAGDARADWLLDYERFVQAIEIPVPQGYRDHEAFNADLAETLSALHVAKSHPVDQTLRHGTQTFGRLFQRTEPVIQKLKAAIEEALRTYIAGLEADPEHPFLRHAGQPWRFSGSWSIRLHDQGYHFSHYHPEGWISSAYYVALPDSVADPQTREGRLHFGVPVVKPPSEVAPAKEIQPKIGTLALFPSYCWHGTVPFSATEPRLTAAFDVAPRR